MNAGLSNLITLKKYLLPNSMWGQTTWDDTLLAVGRGALGALESFCGRKFGRVAGAVEQFGGGVEWVNLSRYPTESVSLVEVRSDWKAGFEAVENAVRQVAGPAGRVMFFGRLGTDDDVIQVTHTGGYWFDETEDNTGTPPEGSEMVPGDLRMAWLLQCETVWSRRDKLGAGLAQGPGKGSALEDLDLVPLAREIARGYRRLAMM